MAVTEKQLYEAFGLGEKAQETAAPATEPQAEDTREGAQVQELADPAASGSASDVSTESGATAASADPEVTENSAQEGTEPENQPLTTEQRRANAARRRQQEQQAAINEALQAERDKQSALMKDFFQRANLKNTFTGQPITTLEEFDSWDKQFKAAQLERDLKAGKLTPEGLEHAISENPAVKRAQEMVRQQDAVMQAQKEAADRAKIDAEIAEIGKIDPTIKSVADLLKMPNAKEFYELVKRGYSFKDAHYVLNGKRLEDARVEAAKQQAMNNARNKDHLNASGNVRGAGAASVPQDVMAMFRRFNPNATEAQIRDYYNKYKNN